MRPTATLSGVTVLLTRPDAYSEYLKESIEQLGGHPIELPTIDIRFTTEGLDRECIASHDIAVFISRTAVAAVSDYMGQAGFDWPASLKCAAVGDKTAKAIRDAFGVSDVIAPAGEYGAESLMQLESMKNLSRKRVIFFDGGGARSVLMVLMLEDRGCRTVTHAVVYERMQSRCDVTELIQTLEAGRLDFAVFTSVEGAENLIAMLDFEYAESLKNSCAIVYSKRIETYLTGQGFNRVVVSEIASDDAALASIIAERKNQLL